jgi:hypothetical protein
MLAALKSRLTLTASVKRDGAWRIVLATDLAPGDLVKLSLGGVVAGPPADAPMSPGLSKTANVLSGLIVRRGRGTDRSKQCKIGLPQSCRSSRRNPLQFEAAPQLARCSPPLFLWRGIILGPSAVGAWSGTSLAPRPNLR